MALTATTFERALDDHIGAIRNRDIDAFARTIARDALLVGPGGSMLHGLDEVVAAHREWFAGPRFAFETQIVSTVERADAAWALMRVRYACGADESRFLLLLLFVPDSGSWKLAYDQNTPLATEPAEISSAERSAQG